MSAELRLKEGKLGEALQLLTEQVRANPADAKRRVFLFQLLALRGQWERADNQLKVASELDAGNALLAGAYSKCIKGERARAEVFAGQRQPVIVGEPESWLAYLLQALKFDAQGQHREASALREQAFEVAEPIAGRLDDKPFEWLADADSRIGPCLEVIVNGGYAWAPFSRIAELSFEAPSDLRDKIWAPVQITWTNGGKAVGFVPARYPGSELSEDAALVTSARTDWIEQADGSHRGLGQRMLAADDGDYALLDVRSIRFEHTGAAANG